MKKVQFLMALAAWSAAASAVAQVQATAVAEPSSTSTRPAASDARAWLPIQGHIQQGLAVDAGSMPIRAALLQLVPSPYQIRLDDRVASDTVLTWPASADWLTALRNAIHPLNLSLITDWSRNTVYLAKTTSLPSGKPPFQMLQTDATVTAMLARWSKEQGWTFFDKGMPTIPITGDADISETSLDAAVGYVMAVLAKPYPGLTATVYPNKVLVVERKPQP